jgi:hypothetical protein
MTKSEELEQRVVGSLARKFGRLVENSVEIIQAASMAPTLPRDADGGLTGEIPPGMTKEQYNVARDALKPSNRAPFYLASAARMVDTAQKIAANALDDDDKMAKVVIHTIEPKTYEIVDVTQKKITQGEPK